MAMVGELTGRVAVVTGGGRGIGEACARLLSERGARVAVADINLEWAEAVARDIDGLAAEVDVVDADGLNALAERVDGELGATDIVVTSAGIIQRPQPPEELPEEVWDKVLEIDLKGTYLTCLAFGALMARRGHGSIITIASNASKQASANGAAYSASKFAVLGLTQAAALDLAPHGITVNAVCPGPINSGRLSYAEQARAEELGMTLDDYRAQLVQEMAQRNPLGRVAESEDVAHLVGCLVREREPEASRIILHPRGRRSGFFQNFGWILLSG